MGAMVRLEWWVHDGGYAVAAGVMTDGQSVPVLVPRSEGGRAHAVNAFDHVGAFLTFAENADSPAGAVGFANQFGLLGHARDDFHLIEVGDDDRETGVGEPLALWKSEAEQMRFAIQLWEQVRRPRPNPERLRPMVRWGLRHLRIFPESPAGQPVEALQHTASAQLTADWEQGRMVPAARLLLLTLMEFKLRDVGVSPGFVIDSDREVSQVLKPLTLLGALWSQFAEAVTGKQHVRCEGCQKWIAIGWDKGGSRTNRRTCSDACRVRAHRRRKAMAK
jgi:hypothetical protein